MDRSWRPLERGDPDFPPELEALDDDMRVERLWLRGRVPDAPRVAIVGTRRADHSGMEAARCLARLCAREGLAVVSGGAHGVDTAAHEASLESGGETLVVMATAPDDPYPVRNRALFERVAERGGLITESPPGSETRPWLFLRRNRLVAALSKSVVVVQAGHRSGALNTAWWARRLGIEVLAVPGTPLSRLSEGPNRLIERAEARILARPGQLVRAAGEGELARGQECARRGLGGSLRTVARLLSSRPATVEDLVRGAGLARQEVLEALLELELRGRARWAGGSGYILVSGREEHGRRDKPKYVK